MPETWDRIRRRYRLVEDVLRHVDRDGLDALPEWDAAITAEYGEDGRDGFLVDVHRRWQRAFDARLDDVLDSEAPDAWHAVAALWQTMTERYPATRLLLDAHAGRPALAAARERHRRMLRSTTGVDLTDLPPSPSAPAQNHGAPDGREHRPRRGLLRLRPVCRRVRREPVPAPGAAARVRPRA